MRARKFACTHEPWNAGTGDRRDAGTRPAGLVRRAADPASDVAELWATLVGNRRAGAAMVIDRLLELGPLRDRRERSVDALWILNDPAHYGSLVSRCGWTEPEFRAWLSRQMAALLS